MEKQHLTYFKIENFKRFDSFEMTNLGQFNLIVGDNNVGKTSVLESLCFDSNINHLLYNFWITFWHRNLEEFKESELSYQVIQQTRFWNIFFKKIDLPIHIKTDIDNILLELRPHQQLRSNEKDAIKESVVTAIPDQWLKLSEGQYATDWQMVAAYFEGSSLPKDINNSNLDSYVPFVSTNIGYSSELVDMYYKFVNSDKNIRKEIESCLRLFIPKIEEIRSHKIGNNEVIGVIISDSNTLYPLTYFGDGTVKYFRLLLQVLVTRNRRLMIDEIGAGIHFTRLKDYWKVIIQLCAKYNVQLFSTTHSLECQRALIEALEGDSMKQFRKDARNITLLENKQGEVKAFTYDFEQFEYSLSIGVNTRGGEL